MSMIDRYRKKGGFFQLLNLIETSGKDKQEKFLKLVGEENPAWEAEVRAKMLTLDKVMSWNPTYLQEIFPRVQPLTLAMIVGGLTPEKTETFKKLLTFKERKGVEDVLLEKTPNAAESAISTAKLFAEIRKMASEGSLKFDKFAPDMVVAEDIEDQLSSGKSVGAFITGATDGKAVGGIDSSVAGGNGALPANVADEIQALRKRLVNLNQDNQRLTQENQSMREKLEQIRKIA